MTAPHRQEATAPRRYDGLRVVVMGLGRFGGGVGVTRFLASRGAKVLVTDLESADALRPSLARLSDLGEAITCRLGEHRQEDFLTADLVVANPAVKPDNPYLHAARQRGIAITSEIRLLLEHLPASSRERIIGVTGTAGKSTTTAMIGHILGRQRDRRVWVGGNLGGSLLSELETIGPEDWIVLELSSFMLEGLRDLRWSPPIAVVTNLTPNHLDWHPTFEHYAAAKQVILEHQRPHDVAILGSPIPRPHLTPRTTRVIDVEGLDTWTRRPPLSLQLPGDHNRLNATLAVEAAVAAAAGDPLLRRLTRDAAAAALADFAGLPHRLQWVCERAGVRFFNDSKSTTPQAAILAIQSFAPGIVHVLIGGYDKHVDLSPLIAAAVGHCRAIYTFGATGPALAEAARRLAASSADRPDIVPCVTLDEAVGQTVSRVRQGDVVLLSPGCASWDQFAHYEARGAAFIEAVLRYHGEGTPPPGPAATA